MDMDKSLFLHELQCLVAALEEGNRINREALELSKALLQQNKDWIEYNKKVREDDIAMQEQRYVMEAKESYVNNT